MTDPALLALPDAARYLGIGKTLFRARVAPALTPVAIGSRRLYAKCDLDAWLATQAVGPSASLLDVTSGWSASSARAAVSSEPRAKVIEARLRNARRRSTPRSSQAA